MAQLLVIGSGSGSGSGPDRFGPKYVVGNVPAGDSSTAYAMDGFYYFPDTGDGAGIEAALAAAAVLPGDVKVRPGSYDLDTGIVTTPLVIPAGTILSGAGVGASTILTKKTGPQATFSLAGVGSVVEQFSVVVQSIGSGSPNPGGNIFNSAAGAVIRRCDLALGPFNLLPGAQTVGFAGSGFTIEDCTASASFNGGEFPFDWKAICVQPTSNVKIRGLETTGFDCPLYFSGDLGFFGDISVSHSRFEGFAEWGIYSDQIGAVVENISLSNVTIDATSASATGGGIYSYGLGVDANWSAVQLNIDASGCRSAITLAGNGGRFTCSASKLKALPVGVSVIESELGANWALIITGNTIEIFAGVGIGISMNTGASPSIIALNMFSCLTPVVSTGTGSIVQILGNN